MLIEPEALQARLDEPDLRIIDATWYLPAQGRNAREEYALEHIPGALYVDLSTDLAEPGAPIRNTIAEPPALAGTFARAGIGTEHRVVPHGHVKLLLFEPAGIAHTGDVKAEITQDECEKI